VNHEIQMTFWKPSSPAVFSDLGTIGRCASKCTGLEILPSCLSTPCLLAHFNEPTAAGHDWSETTVPAPDRFRETSTGTHNLQPPWK
jgi:hypothetical protein